MKRGVFGTRLGFYLASLGSAFGLGNLWRFPYVAFENGGGAFVFLFFLILFVIGLPLIIAELSVGKTTRHSSVLAFKKLGASKFFSFLGPLSSLVSILVLSYYAVISGWVLYFFLKFLSSTLLAHPIDATNTLRALQDSSGLQIALTFLHICVVALIVGRGVQLGIERFVGLFMPLLVMLVFVLCAKSLSMDQAMNSLKFFLYPDFSKLTLSSFGQALGQALFTLGLGFGAMVTFGSYLNDKVFIPFAAFRVVALDALLSLFAGILIFPLIQWTPLTPHGPNLLFQTVPVWLGSLVGGKAFGAAFFLCLYLAALGGSIALFEATVANVQEIWGVSRLQASARSSIFCFVVSLIPALSSTSLKWVNFRGRGLFEIFDSLLIDVFLPIAALLLCLIVGKKLAHSDFARELLIADNPQGERLFRHWVWIIRWLIPGVVMVALVLQGFEFF